MFSKTRPFFFVVLLACISISADAQLLPATDSLYFKNVKVGFTRDAFLGIEAASDLTVLDIRIQPRASSPGEFLLITPTQLTFPLAKGQRVNLILRCKPQLGGQRTASLIISTTAGDTTIELIGEVTTKQPDVVTEPDTIDFGTIFPNDVREIPYIIYGAGIDSIVIANLFTTNDHGPSVYFEVYPIDAAVTFPHRMGPTDTLYMMARFTGYDPVGTKTGRAIVFGDVTGSVGCEFKGIVGKPEMQFSPQLLDLGIVPLGAVVDTFIHIRSIGEGAVTVESITPPPSYIISNIPNLPYDIEAGDSLQLDVRFIATASGVFEQALEAMARVTATGGRFRSALLKAIVLPNQVLKQSPDILVVPCGIDATYQFSSLGLTDSSISPVTISRITSNNPHVIVVDSALFPMTLPGGQTITVALDYNHRNGTIADSAIIEIYSGNYVILRDTVWIETTQQFVALNTSVVDNEVRITTGDDIAPYNLTSLVIEIGIDNPDVASLIINELSIHPSLAGTQMTVTFDSVTRRYRIEFVSSGPISLVAGDLIASIPIEYYYAKDSSALVTASGTIPGLSGCLDVTASSMTVVIPDDCYDDILRRHLQGQRLIGSISISENPVFDGTARLQFDLFEASQVTLAIYDALGNLLAQEYHTGFVSGSTHLSLPLASCSTGFHTAFVTVRNAAGFESVSVPFVVVR